MCYEALVIAVENLGKRYEIYAKPADRLKQGLMPRLARLAGRGARSYFQEFWALRGVTFAVRRSETVGIIGRNGSGKSTLLQMICGTLHPTEGVVEANGRIAALLELGAGFNPEFTGIENIQLSGLLYGIQERHLRERMQAIMDFADIGDFIYQPVKTYSSGMYVRLAFAIAAHVDADTLVIDEALSVGDARFTQKCMRFLRDFQKRGTLVFVSHDSGAVMNLCQRAIWLDNGRIRMDGPAREVVERYLAEQHAADRASLGERVLVGVASADVAVVEDMASLQSAPDLRQPILNGAAGRNLIEVFEFDPERSDNQFGAGSARIVDVRILDSGGAPVQLTAGGEIVDLMIEAEVVTGLSAPILGFYVKDRLGQRLFGDNTYITYRDQPLDLSPGQRLMARFRFRMPVLPDGDYSIDAAFATGSQENHTHHHWLHDALVFKASAGTMRHGLVGIPMQAIRIETLEPGA